MRKVTLLGRLAAWLAYRLFRGPFARRSPLVHKLAMKLFRYGAERGDRAALTTYGSLLHFRGADPQSRTQGALYLQAAAEQGDAKALWLVGKFYEEGVMPFFARDQKRAQECFYKAAELGHPLAQSHVEASER
ncbi:MAG: sel1 repeat family protein [Oceanospirillaceae bacterium]|nr:sel1 repeat family protein [Oceanospirillaceae bacterium]